VSDVPIGAFLSGGIDSSTVVGLMAAASARPIRTYSIGFDGAAADQYYNELPYARRVAQLFGTEHREILVRPDTAALLPRLVWHMDEPVSDSAFITTYLVSEFARRDVTVILLPQPFYDQRIFVDSFLLRGPGWNANFIRKGALVQMALHHELVSVEPRALREAIEARWLAFRDRPAVAPARTSVPSTAAASHSNASKGAAARPAPTSGVVAMGDDSKAMSPWEATKVIVPLIGIAVVLANLIGLWDLPGQDKVREVRAKAREERKYWADSIRRNREESRKLEAEQKELRRQLDEDMRRMFSR